MAARKVFVFAQGHAQSVASFFLRDATVKVFQRGHFSGDQIGKKPAMFHLRKAAPHPCGGILTLDQFALQLRAQFRIALVAQLLRKPGRRCFMYLRPFGQLRARQES